MGGEDYRHYELEPEPDPMAPYIETVLIVLTVVQWAAAIWFGFWFLNWSWVSFLHCAFPTF